LKFFPFEFLGRPASVPVLPILCHLALIAVLHLIAPAPPTSPKVPGS
jgi:hypothetical protein